MQTNIRFLFSSVGGAAMAIALTLGLAALIQSDFEAQERVEIEIGLINPIVDDVSLGPRPDRQPKPYKQVDVPPPPPSLDVVKSTEPDGPVADPVMIPKMKFEEPRIHQTIFKIDDQNVDCEICIAPQMPPSATRSGHCNLRLSVNSAGNPYDVKIADCSESLFARNAIKAVQRFKYRPKIVDGTPVDMHGVRAVITYNLVDENGRLIPE